VNWRKVERDMVASLDYDGDGELTVRGVAGGGAHGGGAGGARGGGGGEDGGGRCTASRPRVVDVYPCST